jgi:putative nucleotidyltransferase with HDIG domain
MPIPQHLLDGIDRLDPLPMTVHRLMELLDDEFVSPRQIAGVVEYDPALTGDILRVANSPLMGSRLRIDRVSDAVVRMGVDQILEIALGSHFRGLTGDAPLYDLTEDELWLHGAVASLAAKEIAAACRTRTVPPLATVAALIHDVGKLILVRHVEVEVDEVVALSRAEGVTFVEAERRALGFDHAEVGAAMAEKWDFPREVVDAVARHHDPEPEEPGAILDTLVLSNLVAKTVGVGLGAEGMNLEVDADLRRRMGFRFEDFGRICSRTATGMEELMGLYGIEQGIGRG